VRRRGHPRRRSARDSCDGRRCGSYTQKGRRREPQSDSRLPKGLKAMADDVSFDKRALGRGWGFALEVGAPPCRRAADRSSGRILAARVDVPPKGKTLTPSRPPTTIVLEDSGQSAGDRLLIVTQMRAGAGGLPLWRALRCFSFVCFCGAVGEANLVWASLGIWRCSANWSS